MTGAAPVRQTATAIAFITVGSSLKD